MDRFELENFIKWVFRLSICIIAFFLLSTFIKETQYFLNNYMELLQPHNQQVIERIVTYGMMLTFICMAIIVIIISIKDIICWKLLYKKVSKDIDEKYNLKAIEQKQK